MIGQIALPPGLRLLTYDQIDSTNDEAKRLAADSSSIGTVVWAKVQTSGKGRQQRSWVSEPGNLYSSVILQAKADLGTSSQLGFVVSLAARDAVLKVAEVPISCTCKWPNDVLLNGGKIAGILLEALPGLKNPTAVVAGCGLNIAHSPSDTTYPATSLAAEGVETSVKVVAEIYWSRLTYWHGIWLSDGFAPIRTAWRESSHRTGDRMILKISEEKVSGAFVDLDDDGALILDVNGTHRRFTAGDVYFPAENKEPEANDVTRY